GPLAQTDPDDQQVGQGPAQACSDPEGSGHRRAPSVRLSWYGLGIYARRAVLGNPLSWYGSLKTAPTVRRVSTRRLTGSAHRSGGPRRTHPAAVFELCFEPGAGAHPQRGRSGAEIVQAQRRAGRHDRDVVDAEHVRFAVEGELHAAFDDREHLLARDAVRQAGPDVGEFGPPKAQFLAARG